MIGAVCVSLADARLDPELCALPYWASLLCAGFFADFRLDTETLASAGQLQQMAKEVYKKVDRSGQKAILLGHSSGAAVALKLLQDPAM